MTKQCSNCGFLASNPQLSGVSQRCPDCEEWVIWQPVEETGTRAPGADSEDDRLSALADRLLPRRRA
ncbi:hypothetical protein [Saliphagus sp. LR7]|uniref:hypothetical protein n=1 Tax=Saliphagus sp. LR7 TaxID=2282654 RepID=UPI000DF7AAF8|nr:hypothetical protein [Saliphagus sp. LR7]